jgi:hypothetical protein
MPFDESFAVLKSRERHRRDVSAQVAMVKHDTVAPICARDLRLIEEFVQRQKVEPRLRRTL